MIVYVMKWKPKPPSDEGGGSAVRLRRRERNYPSVTAYAVTAPLTRGALVLR